MDGKSYALQTKTQFAFVLTVQKDGLSSSESPERLDACRSEPAFGTWGKNHDHVGSFRGGVEIASTCCTPQRGDSSTRDTSARVLHRFPSWDRRDLNSVLGRALSARPLSSQCCPSASSSSGLAPCSSSTGCHQVSAPPTCRPAASQLLTGGTQNNCRGSVDPPFSSSTNGAGPPPVLRLCSASVTPTSRGGLYGRVVRASSPNGRDNVRLAACHSEPAVFEQHAASQGNQAARRHVSAAAAVNSRKPCQVRRQPVRPHSQSLILDMLDVSHLLQKRM